jgi:hypothetical protein
MITKLKYHSYKGGCTLTKMKIYSDKQQCKNKKLVNKLVTNYKESSKPIVKSLIKKAGKK